MSVETSNERLVELGDLDELVRHVDRLVDDAAWDGLVDLRDRCRAALARGKQLWPAASLAEYRLALDAPGPWAGSVIEPGAGHLTLGPLPEVAASTHTWDELVPSIPDGPLVTVTAHERVIRGEDLTGDTRLDDRVIDLPARLHPWEGRYPLAEYEADHARFPPPPRPEGRAVTLPTPATPVEDHRAVDALLELPRAWTSQSDGRSEAVAVDGDALGAIAGLGPSQARVAELDPAGALCWMAWVGASGGAHGRRRGMAAGRFAAWWAVVALGGLTDDWPIPPDQVGEVASELRWFAWDAWEPDTGWRFHLAVEDPVEGLAWAVAATDAA